MAYLKIYASGFLPLNNDNIVRKKNDKIVNDYTLLDKNHQLTVDNAQLSDTGLYNISVYGVISVSQGFFCCEIYHNFAKSYQCEGCTLGKLSHCPFGIGDCM